ncbi:MAG TPA: hypothetical protein VKR58_11300 [Aquella sp.]|nr:hypothetical protein [Aquella sp.]
MKTNKLNVCLLGLLAIFYVSAAQAVKIKCADIKITGSEVIDAARMVELACSAGREAAVSADTKTYTFNFQWEYTKGNPQSTFLKIIRRRVGLADSVLKYEHGQFNLDFINDSPAKMTNLEEEANKFSFIRDTTRPDVWSVNVDFLVNPLSSSKTFRFTYKANMQCTEE